MSYAKTSAASAAILVLVTSCDPEVGFLRPVDGASDAGPRPAGEVSFARDIRPILDRGDGPPAGCKRCHYRDQPSPQGFELGGLDLSTLGALRRGGVSSGTRIVVAGAPDESVLVQKLEGTYARGARMPKDLTPLSADEIALVRQWIAEGAKGADDE